MAAKKKRRIRSPHPGVVLVQGSGEHVSWRMKFKDPDSGKVRWERVDPDQYAGAEARRDLAIRKSKELADRARSLEGGAPRAQGALLKDVLEGYFKEQPRLSKRSVKIARTVTKKFLAWAESEGLRSADDMNRARLKTFKAHLAAERKRIPKKGGKRGDTIETDEMRSPVSVNHDLCALCTVLRDRSDSEQFARLSRLDIEIGLKRLDEPEDPAQPLKPHQLQELLKACIRHDEATYACTRHENRGGGIAGSTHKYTAMGPFFLYLLLSGLRLGEAEWGDWPDVDLEASDDFGEPCGEVRVWSSRNKSRVGRVVPLDVSPSLRLLLGALKERSGGKGSMWGMKRGTIHAAVKRLREQFEAPEFDCQQLRSTCSSYLTNAPGIYGAAAPYHSAKRLGHDVKVAEESYLAPIRGIPLEARTLEAAMGIEEQVKIILRRAGVPAAQSLPSRQLAKSSKESRMMSVR